MDTKSWAKDIFSPSNLWTAFQFGFPAGAGAVSGWVSYLWHLPPSVTALVALMTAASVMVVVSEVRNNTIVGKMVLTALYPQRFIWSTSTQTGFVQLRAILRNNHPLHRIFYRLETLHLSIQGKTYGHGVKVVGDVFEISPLGDAGYLFIGIDGVTLGAVDGRLHYRVRFGNSPHSLGHSFEQKLLLKGAAFIDAAGQPHFDMNWLIEDNK
jgi:hypothetical protein